MKGCTARRCLHMANRMGELRLGRTGLCVFLALFSSALAELRDERVFGPETPTGRYKHPASVTELVNGDLYLAFYGGDGEYSPGTAIYGSRRLKDTRQWSPPVVIARDPFHSVGNAVVWQAPDQLVWLFFVVRFGDTWSDSRVAVKVSKDGASTWSDTSMLTFEAGTMVQGRPIVLSDGYYLLPAYHETGSDREYVGDASASFFLRFDPAAQVWTETARIRSPRGNLQPAVAELDPGRLVAYCRRGGGYGPGTRGYLVRSESPDGGQTWHEGKDSSFPNPNAAVSMLKLRNEHLLLFYNDSMTKRTPLTVAVSTDSDRSWPLKCPIRTGEGSFAYPYAIQTRDDRIHLVFTSEERSVINHVEFEEQDILQCAQRSGQELGSADQGE